MNKEQELREATLSLLKRWKGEWPSWFVHSLNHPAWFRKQTKACIKQIRSEEEHLFHKWQGPIQQVVEETTSEWDFFLSPLSCSEGWVESLTTDWTHRYLTDLEKEMMSWMKVAEKKRIPETRIRDELRAILNLRIRSLSEFVPYLLHDARQRTILHLMERNEVEMKEWHTHCESPFCSLLAYQRRRRNEAFFVSGETIQFGSEALQIEKTVLCPPLHLSCRCEIVPVRRG